MSLSSTEAEYIALAETCLEVVCLLGLCSDFNIAIFNIVNVDNQSFVRMVEMKKFSSRTKHVAVKYHFVSDLKEHGKVDQILSD